MSTVRQKVEKLRRSAFIRIKAAAQRMRAPAAEQSILMIVGCQRSGTTLLSQIFEKDWQAISYGEGSRLSYSEPPRKLRLLPLNDISNILNDVRPPLVVMKPLVESQRTLELLDHFPNSRAIWIYRDFKDVAASNVNKFGIGNGIDDIRPIVKSVANNWRAEFVSEQTKEILRRHFSEDMNPLDAAVLFWIARNALYFELGLPRDDRVALCRYEDLAKDPADVMRQVYAFAGRPYPGDRIVSETHGRSVNKGRHVRISPPIEETATELLQALDDSRTIRLAGNKIE